MTLRYVSNGCSVILGRVSFRNLFEAWCPQQEELTGSAGRKEIANLREKTGKNAEFQKVQRTERGFCDEHFQKKNQCIPEVLEIM